MFDGGYYLLKNDLVRSGYHQHTAANPNAISDAMLEAVNTIQNTPWMVDTWALDLMREAWVNGDKLGALPEAVDQPLPPTLPDDEWEAMADDARRQHKQRRVAVHEYNGKLRGKREAFLRKVEVAERLRNAPIIYMPHFLDFRGRFYPLVQDLQPQGDDISRALLKFAEGKALGKGGVYWLGVRLANCFGQDKLTFHDRLAWVLEHEKLIFDAANDPLDGQRFWLEADEPWSALVTCREWAMAHEGRPEEFISHLPIPMDGTANGLQHLSLMGRDPIGAEATCCTESDVRRDIYTEVANAVEALVLEDVKAGVPEAAHWMARGIDRKVVKRAVMTTPYGVTDRGIRDQLVSDGFCYDLDGELSTNARYMQEKISAGLSSTVSAAKQIMAYLQTVAHELAVNELPFRWCTPLGMEVTQAYYKQIVTRVKTLHGRIDLWDEDIKSGLNVRKQAFGAAPNFVHSYDAAMLAETVLRCRDEHSIASFACIHDSYATHAANTGTMAHVLRRVAADFYEQDQLALLEDYVRSYAPEVSLPERPPLGTFDPQEVLRAPYFFA